MDNGGLRHHTAAMGPHPWQQSTQQSTYIICDGSTSLKLEKIYLLLVILLIMHVGSTSTSDDDDAATRRWAPCSPLDDIANSDGRLPLPRIYSTRAGGGGEGGRGLRTSNVVSTYGGDRATGVVATERYFLVECSYVREKVWAPYNINMVPD
jgi:hypothetical protein